MFENKKKDRIVEVILSGASAASLKNTVFKNNEMVEFRVPLSVADISNIDNYNIELPSDIYHEKIICDLTNEISRLIFYAKRGYQIRVWSSHIAPDSYLLLLFICNILKDEIDHLEVLYSDEYDNDCFSPGVMTSDELEKLSKLKHVLSKDEIIDLSDKWDNIKKEKSDLRIIKNGTIKLVSFDYFYDEILNLVKESKSTKIISVVYQLSKKYHISDSIFVFLISRLIDLGRIEVLESNEVFIKSVIKKVDSNE